jgi:ABC-type molybdate transport system substrate-binding protein
MTARGTIVSVPNAIKILSGGAMRPLMAELVPRFEHAHGMTIDIEFRLTSALKQAIAAGATFDIAVLPRPDLNDLIEQGAIASGAYIAALLAKLGIAEEMAPKTKRTGEPVAELVARGEAELGMQQIVAILPVRGAELVGPLPAELQNVIIYAAGLSSGTRQAVAAEGFIAFTRTEEAKRLMCASGLEPA